MNRPERLNALNTDLIFHLAEAMEDLRADEGIHAVIITGAGRSFTSGADLEGMKDVNTRPKEDAARVETRNIFDRLEEAFETFDKPLIAAANGLGVGFGFTMLGYCDFVFVSETAKFRTPFSQLGLCPEASASYTFPLKMGWAEASRALLLGEWFSAQDVVASGLAQEVVPPDALMGRAREFARKFEDCPLQSLKATKRLMMQAHLPAIQSVRAAENAAMRDLLGTEANKQAIAAFFAREQKSRK
jgi:enoyl-CoA hydratase/carnithine racemase